MLLTTRARLCVYAWVCVVVVVVVGLEGGEGRRIKHREQEAIRIGLASAHQMRHLKVRQ